MLRNSSLPAFVVVLLLAGPVIAGLAGTALPAFGYLPVLGHDALSLSPFQSLLAQPGLPTSVALSLGTGLAASMMSLAIVCLFAAGWYGTKTFNRFSRFLSPFLSVPHAAAAIGLSFLIAPSGFLVRVVSPWATGWTRPPDLLILQDPIGLTMTFGLVLKEVPFLFLMMLAALSRPGLQMYTKAATTLGYNRVTAFVRIILPQIYPLMRLPILAVIAYSTSVVDVAQILGPTTPAPLAPRLVGWMQDPDTGMRLIASAGALVQLLVSLGAIAIYLLFEKLFLVILHRQITTGAPCGRGTFSRAVGFAVMLTSVVIAVASLIMIGLWTFAKSWWFPSPLPQRWGPDTALANLAQAAPSLHATLVIGTLSALAAIFFLLWFLEDRTHNKRADGPFSRGLTFLIFLPLIVPQISFLFGLHILFLNLSMAGTLTAVVLVHLVFVFPYCFLALSDAWQRLDPRYVQLATSMGAPRLRVFWRVSLPLLLKPVLVATAIGLAVSVGQYLPTLVVGAGRVVTVTTESVALASGGSRQASAVYAFLQLLVPLTGFVLASFIPAIVFKNKMAMRTAITQ